MKWIPNRNVITDDEIKSDVSAKIFHLIPYEIISKMMEGDPVMLRRIIVMVFMPFEFTFTALKCINERKLFSKMITLILIGVTVYNGQIDGMFHGNHQELFTRMIVMILLISLIYFLCRILEQIICSILMFVLEGPASIGNWCQKNWKK